MLIRRATEADADALAQLMRDAFVEFERFYTRAGYTATTADAPTIRARLAEGPTWVAHDDAQIIGTVSAVAQDGGVYVRSMAVAPVARGKRAALRLMRQLELFAVSSKARGSSSAPRRSSSAPSACTNRWDSGVPASRPTPCTARRSSRWRSACRAEDNVDVENDPQVERVERASLIDWLCVRALHAKIKPADVSTLTTVRADGRWAFCPGGLAEDADHLWYATGGITRNALARFPWPSEDEVEAGD